ncbi:hypothetical protein K3495_g4390 [Podosphaera aphanis]|nr:hypothetical protein K3495_g4390 [Podosphaera aphanis]
MNLEASCHLRNEDVQLPIGQRNRNINGVIEKYLLENSIEYRKLHQIRHLKKWSSKDETVFYEKRSSATDKKNDYIQRMYFSMMCQIGNELHHNTSALTPITVSDEGIQVLDICMAPGGISSTILKVHQDAKISAITLPPSQNGLDILLHNWEIDRRIRYYFGDVTMLLTEMGGTTIPFGHPDATNFLTCRPFCDRKFDLVVCDGQVLQRHQRSEFREKREPWRLLMSQLVLALTRIKSNGTLVLLLHNLDSWETIILVQTLNGFSSVELFKPRKAQGQTSLLYVVAKNIQAQGAEVNAAIKLWKEEWHMATFKSDKEYNQFQLRHDKRTIEILRNYGKNLIHLGEPIWRIQRTALESARVQRNK